jgi:bifunctional NMN adenylyltransferase/nudix hydrolase
MIVKENKADIGVIIGRFQINRLHDAHRALIDSVLEKHSKVILFLGVAKSLGTRKNPLDFASRKVMIDEEYSDKLSVILPLMDMKDDLLWSKQVDEKIREAFSMGSVILYGSRDSFIPHYHGKFNTCELEAAHKVSATEVRDEVSKKVVRSEHFRAGVIYSAYNTFPHVFPTVDVAIVKEETGEVLLGRKPYEEKFRFIGGFTDVEDENYETAARREVHEETGVDVGNPQYLGSARVDDWRYRSNKDRGIITLFFKAPYVYGNPKAQDDIVEVRWFQISDLTEDNLVGEHVKLLKFLK